MCNTNNTQAFLATEGGADDDDDEWGVLLFYWLQNLFNRIKN